MTVASAIDAGIRALGRVNAGFAKASLAVAAAFLAAMTLIVLTQVVFRYGLNDSLAWSEELAKTMMVWLTFLVAPAAYRRGLNVAIDIFAEAFPARARQALNIALNLVVAWILGVFFVESFAFVARGTAATAATLPVKMAWFYSILPVSFAAMLLVAAEIILLEARRLVAGTTGKGGAQCP